MVLDHILGAAASCPEKQDWLTQLGLALESPA